MRDVDASSRVSTAPAAFTSPVPCAAGCRRCRHRRCSGIAVNCSTRLREVRRQRSRSLRLLEDRHDASCHAGRHAGAAERMNFLPDQPFDEVSGMWCKARSRRRFRSQEMPRRDDIGFRQPVEPGRAARAVGRHAVVVARDGVLVIERADGDRRRRVAGGGRAGKTDFAVSGLTPKLPAEATTMMPARDAPSQPPARAGRWPPVRKSDGRAKD